MVLSKSGFALSVSRVGDEITLGVSGRLDATTHETLRKAIEDACTTSPIPVTLYLDLTDLADLDADGIALLVQTAERCAEFGVQLRPTFGDTARRVLEAAGYDEQFRPIARGQ